MLPSQQIDAAARAAGHDTVLLAVDYEHGETVECRWKGVGVGEAIFFFFCFLSFPYFFFTPVFWAGQE